MLSQDHQTPNIIVIYSDDHTAQSIGAYQEALSYGLKLDHTPTDEWELFDLETDPEQLNSVYGDPEYAEMQEELKDKLDELQEKYEDDSWSHITPGVPFHGMDQ